MTPAEVNALYAQAQAELNANEEAMLIHPLALVGVIDLLRYCESQRAAVESYDELHIHEA